MSSPSETTAEQSEPKRIRGWRKFLQFRLLTVLILITVISVWLGWWMHEVHQQRDTVSELRMLSATISYDFEAEGLEAPHVWPAWLVDWLGVDYFADVVSVDLFVIEFDLNQKGSVHQLEINDSILGHLQSISTLKTIRYDALVDVNETKHLELLFPNCDIRRIYFRNSR